MIHIFQFVGELMIWFALGTMILWVASHATNSPNANIKTAAIANVALTVLYAVLIGMSALLLLSQTEAMAPVFLIGCIVITIVSFVFLMKIYEISFFSTIWLVIAMIALGAMMEKIMDTVS